MVDREKAAKIGLVSAVKEEYRFVKPKKCKFSEITKAMIFQVGSCDLKNQCSGSPCKNGGLCLQNFTNFECSCDGTG